MPPARGADGRFIKGGGGAGIARAGIEVDTSQLERAGQVVTKTSQGMRQSFNAVGGELKNLQSSAQQTNSAFSALFQGAFVTGGLAAAQNLSRTEAMFKVLAGSQQNANRYMAELASLAERTGTPMNRLKESAVSLLPAISRSNASLSDTLSIVQRLAVLDPAAGIAGASIGVKEFLSGDYVSLVERFELSRQQLKAIRDEAGGSADAMIAGLSRLVDGLGLTEEALGDLNKSGINAFDNARAAAQEALAVGFTPLLQTITPLVQEWSSFLVLLNKSSPEFLQIASAVGIAIVAINTMSAAYAKLISLNAGLKAQQGMSGFATRSVVGAAAVYGGSELGLAGSRLIGQAATNAGIKNTDLNRLASANQDEAREMLTERLKQLILIFSEGIREAGNTIIDLISIFEAGEDLLGNAFRVVGAGIEVGGSYLQEAFGGILQVFGTLIEGIGDLASKIPGVNDDIKNTGRDLAASGEWNRLDARGRRDNALNVIQQGIGLTPDQRDSLRENNLQRHDDFNIGMRDLQESLFNMLYPAQEARQELEKWVDSLGNVKSTTNALRSASDAAQKVITDFAAEMKKVAEERGIQTGREEEDFLRKRQRDLAEFGRNQAETEISRNQDRITRIKGFQDEETEASTQAIADRLKAEQEFAAAEIQRAIQHEQTLEKIKVDGARAVEDAAANLDARSVAAALRSTNQKLSDANTTFAEETKQKNEQFQLQLAEDAVQFTQMQAQKAAQFVQQLAAEDANYEAQRAKQAENFQRQLALEDEERNIKLTRQQEDWAREDELRRQKADEQLAKMAEELDAEKALQDQWLAAQREFLDGSRTDFEAYMHSLEAAVKNFTKDQINAGPTAPIEETLTPGKGLQQGIGRFASGGRPALGRYSMVGENGPELLKFNSPARVFSNPESRNIMSDMMHIFAAPPPAMPAGSMGSSSGNISIGPITLNNDFGDIGSHSMQEIEGTMRRVWGEQMTELLTKAGQPS